MNAPHQSPESLHVAVWRQQLDALRQQAVAWWGERTSQERILLRVATGVVVAALVWTQALQPALNTITQARELLPRLHADAAQVDALILDAQAWQRKQSGKIDAAGLSQALGNSLQRAGLEESATLSESRNSTGGSSRHWEIVLFNANAARVMEWLAGLPYLLQLQTLTVELARANVDGRDRPGHVSGRIVVRQPAQRTP